MGLASDARVLWTLLRGQPDAASHAERLNRFYGPQAKQYDQFRERLLHGRAELLESLAARLNPGASLVELGAGTGRNLAFLQHRIDEFQRVQLVDLCAPLVEQARERWKSQSNVELIEADATTWRPDQAVDAVYLSYALTMIPDWFAALDNALAMLKPGGLLGVVDFYVSRRRPDAEHHRHGGFTRHFWPAWFAHDGVHPSPDHLPYLEYRLETLERHEARASVPYLPGVRVPYYRFVGRKAGD